MGPRTPTVVSIQVTGIYNGAMKEDAPEENLDRVERIERHLRKLLGASASARAFVEGMTFEEFSSDRKTVYAVLCALAMMGDAVEKLPQDFLAQYRSVPWEAMVQRRDKLLHGYYDVDLNRVWEDVTEGLPQVESEVCLLLSRTQG